MHTATLTKVLLIEDDEDDYILTRALLSDIAGQQFTLDWAKTFGAGLEALCRNEHDVALVDYRLGAPNGVELLREAQEQNCGVPIILLTGSGQHHVDLEAMNAGAADYLVKSQLRADSLERSIRYAIQRRRAAAVAAFEQARLASFGAEIGLALTQRDSLEAILQRCANAMTQYLNAAVAQIATYEPRNRVFEPRGFASSLTEMQNVEWGVQNNPYQIGAGQAGCAAMSYLSNVTADLGNDDFCIASLGRNSAGPSHTYDPADPEASRYNVSAMADFDNDLVAWSGNWIVAPATALVGGTTPDRS